MVKKKSCSVYVVLLFLICLGLPSFTPLSFGDSSGLDEAGTSDLSSEGLLASASDSERPGTGDGILPEDMASSHGADTSIGVAGSKQPGPGSSATVAPQLESQPTSGAATAQIPIVVPPGRASIAPSLYLQYNSNQGNGWIGIGITLDMGAIERSTKRGINYNGYDFVAVINGSQGELVPEADWGTGYYRNKIESDFSRYYLNPATGGWEVTTKDGTRYLYGTGSASRQDNSSGVLKWYLDKVRDTNGNYMIISYTKADGHVYPDRIDYAGNEIQGLSPSNSVKFYLESRPDICTFGDGIGIVKTNYRLRTIDIKGGGNRARVYSITY